MASTNTLSTKAIEVAIRPFLGGESVSVQVIGQLKIYLDLLLRWNARTNLTSIREPVEIVKRHFGESLFAASLLGECATLLDFGSGAGFPGIPIQLLRPEIQVTLAESQNKKATFLREVIRTLHLPTEVWSARVETMPLGRSFEVVALRAVDSMDEALLNAAEKASRAIMVLSTVSQRLRIPPGFEMGQATPIPKTEEGQVIFLHRMET